MEGESLYLLGIDIGTTSVKAVVFNENGRRISKAVEEYSLETPRPDYVELDPEVYWRSCIRAVREAAKPISDKNEIKALSISSQGETLIAIDERGNPLQKAIVWLDNRSKDEAEEIAKRFGREVYEVTGQPTVVPTWPATKILWMKKRVPHLFKEVRTFMMVEDYIIYRLTGKRVTEPSICSSTLLFDIRRDRRWGEMLEYLGINEDQLPEIVRSGAVIGELTEEASESLGLPKQTIVASGAFDQAAAAIGAGNIEEGVVSESTGAALAIVATTTKRIYDPMKRIPLHRHAAPRLYFLMPWCQTAGIILKWFRDRFAQPEKVVGEMLGISAYEVLDREAERVPPGSGGLIILPHFAGAASPEFDPMARGVFFGLTLSHDRRHIVRAMLEAIGYMLRRNIELLKGLGISIKEVRSIGGGARSRIWCRIKADILQTPILVPVEEETACLGAAILAGIASGEYRDLRDAVKRLVIIKERIDPDPGNRLTYTRLYEIYVELYEKLREIFPKLAAASQPLRE